MSSADASESDSAILPRIVVEPAWPAPQPLPNDLPPVTPFDPELLPGTFRPFVLDITERLQCPPDFPAVASMVVLSTIIGRQVGIRPKRFDDWLVIPNLWGAVVGRPGVLKTPAIQEPLKLFSCLEEKARKAYASAIEEHEAKMLVRRASAKEIEKAIAKAFVENKDPQELARLAVQETPQLPLRRRYLTNDVTVEKLGEILSANPRGILLFRDELLGLLKNLDREGSEGARAFFLEAWNGDGRFTYDRIGRGTVEIEAACLSLLGGIQPGPLMEYQQSALRGGAGDDGLIQRFQLMVWPDISGGWQNVDRSPNREARRMASEVIERLDQLDPNAIAQADEGALPFLRFDPQAQEIFDDWREKLERRLRSGDLHPAFEAHLAKYRSLVPALALICDLADSVLDDFKRLRCGISQEAALRACAWAEYLETHAMRLYGYALDPVRAPARELLRHLKKGDLTNPFSARDVYLKGWKCLDPSGTEAALHFLADLDYLRSYTMETGGRPRILWRIHPTVLESNS